MSTDAKVCCNCHGEKGMWVTPYKVSPPSKRGCGGYEPNSNIKLKIYVVCDGCNGKGYIK